MIKNITLTGLVTHLNNTYVFKKSGKSFNTTDVQGYIRRGMLPRYLGGNRISKTKVDRIYNVLD